MEEQQNLEIIMQLIMYGGDAKGKTIEAMAFAKTGDFISANESMAGAEAALIEAHHAQTDLLTQEASGDAVALSLLMVHGQDHLMTAIAFKDMAKEIIDVYQKLEEK